jgi:hypothetical protein
MGRLTLANGARVGLIRIAEFGDGCYPKVASALWEEFAARLDSDCTLRCQWEFRIEVMNGLLGYLAECARSLTAAGIDALLVDLSGNGGGSDWAAIAPRIFAPPLSHCPQSGLIRHPHHADPLRKELAALEAAQTDSTLSASSRRYVEMACERLREIVAAMDRACNRRAIFDQPDFRADCSQVQIINGCGVLDYLLPGSLEDLPVRTSIFEPLRYRYEEGLWTGPLFVVLDGETASASEQFLALLEANSAATFLGQRSFGAGCGYYGGGVPALLQSLDLTVRMPDCVRYRGDGQNELEGIEPQVAIDWGGGNRERARRVQLALEQLVAPSARSDAQEDRAALRAASARGYH